jgi:hypothetical protein
MKTFLILVLLALVVPTIGNAGTLNMRLDPAAHAIEASGWDLETPGFDNASFDDSNGDGRAEVWCWDNDEFWNTFGSYYGFFDGYINVPNRVCRPLIRSLDGWTPITTRGRYRLGYMAFVLGHESAHAAGAGHDELNCKSADGIAAANIRRILRRLGVSWRERRRIERALMLDTEMGVYPSRTARCWQAL